MGNDTLFGSAGNDTLNGGAGSDTASYNSLGNTVTLGAFGVLNKGALGTDSLVGIETVVGSSLLGDTVDHSGAVSGGGVTVTGTTTNLTTGVVTVNGSGAPLPLTFNVQQFENVIGSNFNDSITGNAAANSLNGGLGSDTLTGGLGIDSFVYRSIADSAFGAMNRDTITDFLLGVDKLDLSAIDANLWAVGDQAFTFAGTGGYTAIGQLRYQVTGGNLFLYGNVDSNFATSEFELQLSGLASIAATNIIL